MKLEQLNEVSLRNIQDKVTNFTKNQIKKIKTFVNGGVDTDLVDNIKNFNESNGRGYFNISVVSIYTKSVKTSDILKRGIIKVLYNTSKNKNIESFVPLYGIDEQTNPDGNYVVIISFIYKDKQDQNLIEKEIRKGMNSIIDFDKASIVVTQK